MEVIGEDTYRTGDVSVEEREGVGCAPVNTPSMGSMYRPRRYRDDIVNKGAEVVRVSASLPGMPRNLTYL